MTYYITLPQLSSDSAARAQRAALAYFAYNAGCTVRSKGCRAVICETNDSGFPDDTGLGRSVAARFALHRTDRDDLDSAAKAWL